VNTGIPPVSPSLQRVSELLARVLALTDKVISERVTWKASPPEWDFLLEVSSLTERVLPAEAATDPSAALAFLLLVRFSLESTVRALRDPSGPN
jgi:hypothetical protein